MGADTLRGQRAPLWKHGPLDSVRLWATKFQGLKVTKTAAHGEGRTG